MGEIWQKNNILRHLWEVAEMHMSCLQFQCGMTLVVGSGVTAPWATWMLGPGSFKAEARFFDITSTEFPHFPS